MRRYAALAVLSLLAASTTSVLAGPATAASPRADQARDKAHQRIVDYWTPARRANAKPRDVVLPDPRAKGQKPDKPGGGKGGGKGGGGKDDGAITGSTWSGGGAVAQTTGKVFFLIDGNQYTCSASAVDGDGVDVVLTAGHCVWDDAAGFATFFLFVPGYEGTMPPEGERWTATSLFTTEAWADDGDSYSDDAGLAVMDHPAYGSFAEALEVDLPTMAIPGEYASSEGDTFSAFGYPAAQKYKGSTLTYCEGPVELGFSDALDTLSMPCDMTGGSSGGPWYDGPAGQGAITSLNSYGYNGIHRMFGPTFDAEQEGAMKDQATDGACDAGERCTSKVTGTL